MSFDPGTRSVYFPPMELGTLLLAVQLSARTSALLFAGALALPVLTGRRLTGLYPAFLVAHTVHFGFVAAYAAADGPGLFPGGRTLADVGGWPTLAAVAGLFYALALAGLASRVTGRFPIGGRLATGSIGSMFVATYVPLIERSVGYAGMAALVTFAVGVESSTLRRLFRRFSGGNDVCLARDRMRWWQ